MVYVRSDRRELWIANRDGTDARHVTEAGEGVTAPRWLPDTRHLAFVRDGLVWLLDTAGGESVAVAGPLGRGRDIATGQEPTDHSPGARWEQLYSVAP
jgi:Tol biopolymer transport system component